MIHENGGGLFSRVKDDLTLLRRDVGNLMSHTAHNLPQNARGLADQAMSAISAKGSTALSRVRTSLQDDHNRERAAWIGGGLLLGLVATGLYALYRGGSQQEEQSQFISSRRRRAARQIEEEQA